MERIAVYAFYLQRGKRNAKKLMFFIDSEYNDKKIQVLSPLTIYE